MCYNDLQAKKQQLRNKMIKHQKTIETLIWIAIVMSTMSFFGFVYEEIDFIPNYFSKTPMEAKIQWNSFHSLTNPAYYHIPPSIIAIFSITVIWFYNQYLSKRQIGKLRVVSILILLVNILTGIAVTQINDKLYFEIPVDNSETVKDLATIWAILNFIRIFFTAICTIMLVKMFSIKLIINNSRKKKPAGNKELS